MACAPTRRGRLVRGDRPRVRPPPVDRVLLGASAWPLVGACHGAFGPWRARPRRTSDAGRRRAQYARDSRPRRTEPGDRSPLAACLRTTHARVAPTNAQGRVRDEPCLRGARLDDLRALRTKRPPSLPAMPPTTSIRPSATHQEHPPRRGRAAVSSAGTTDPHRHCTFTTSIQPRNRSALASGVSHGHSTAAEPRQGSVSCCAPTATPRSRPASLGYPSPTRRDYPGLVQGSAAPSTQSGVAQW